MVPTNENKDETLTQSNLGQEILVIQSNRSQEPTKVPSNHSAKDPQKTCLESPENQSQKWTKPEVQQLLILYKANEEKFRDPKWKKKSIWKEISKEMNQHGYSYSALKCEVKFKNLKQKYVKTVDHNNKSGNSFKTCSFFDELNEIFACNPSVEPVAECSNRKGYTKAVDNEETAAENIHSIDDMCTPQKTSDQKKGKPEKRRFSVTESLANIREDLKKENEQKIQKMEEMHKEKMQRFDRLLNLYERDLSLNNK